MANYKEIAESTGLRNSLVMPLRSNSFLKRRAFEYRTMSPDLELWTCPQAVLGQRLPADPTPEEQIELQPLKDADNQTFDLDDAFL